MEEMVDTFDEGAGEPLVQRQQELRAIWAALDRVHAQLVENKDPQGSMRPPALINTYGAGKSVLARAVAPADVPMATVCFGGHMDPRRLLLLESTRRPADDPARGCKRWRRWCRRIPRETCTCTLTKSACSLALK